MRIFCWVLHGVPYASHQLLKPNRFVALCNVKLLYESSRLAAWIRVTAERIFLAAPSHRLTKLCAVHECRGRSSLWHPAVFLNATNSIKECAGNDNGRTFCCE